MEVLLGEKEWRSLSLISEIMGVVPRSENTWVLCCSSGWPPRDSAHRAGGANGKELERLLCHVKTLFGSNQIQENDPDKPHFSSHKVFLSFELLHTNLYIKNLSMSGCQCAWSLTVLAIGGLHGGYAGCMLLQQRLWRFSAPKSEKWASLFTGSTWVSHSMFWWTDLKASKR